MSKEKIKQPIYKVKKTFKLWCPTCKQFLDGNGSLANPYNCKCGTWEREFGTEDLELELIKFPKENGQ